MEFRQYQIDIAHKACDILNRLNIVYIAAQVRTGKTLMAFKVAELYGAKNVLFLTKKKAISSIESDYGSFPFPFALTVINDESMHTLDNPKQFDLIIHDEHHRFGAFPKMGKTTKLYRTLFGFLPMIFLSGTPTPESFSQIYHQFCVSAYSPFSNYRTFYA
jgi:superfamily II DNA or RNA helicase